MNFFNFGSGTDGLMLPEQVIARGYDIDLSRNFVLKLGLEVGSDLSSSLRAIANVGVELRF